MVEWFSDNWIALAAVLGGIVACTAAGLMALIPDPEQPAKFLPVYAFSMTLFLFGLILILWCEQAHTWSDSIQTWLG